MKRFGILALVVVPIVVFAVVRFGNSTHSQTFHVWPASVKTTSECKSYFDSNHASKVRVTNEYVVVAGFGPSEQMYTPSQVISMRPNSGEVMIAGMMNNGDGAMTMDPKSSMMHLEIHACSRSTGLAEMNVIPRISIKNLTTSTMSILIPVAVMQGLNRVASDTHYGNNVQVYRSQIYQVRVTFGGEVSVFNLVS